MKRFILAVVMALALKAGAGDLIQLMFTRSDGTVWQMKALTPYPQTPMPFGQSDSYRGVNGIGSHTNVYNGNTYSINPATDMLLRDGVPVGQFHWRTIGTNYTRIDVITHYGFTIDGRGHGWLATAQNDGDPQYYLFEVDLSTAEVFYIDRIGNFLEDPEAGMPVNGLVVVIPPFRIDPITPIEEIPLGRPDQ